MKKTLCFPPSVESFWQQKLAEFCERSSSNSCHWLQKGIEKNRTPFSELPKIWGCSAFIANRCIADPALFEVLLESGDLDIHYARLDFQKRLEQTLDVQPNEKLLMEQLRKFRSRELIRIIWRDFTRQASMEQTTTEMTWLAETIIDNSLQLLHEQLVETWGQPVNQSGIPQHLIVLGMGKLGAWELNVSSDIDLIFAYPESGQTQGGKRQCSNQEFFVRLGQQLIRVLNENTTQGFVFRVDMRLRPYGSSGPLVMSFEALELYYQTQGRDWERYAMIKARIVAGDRTAGQQFMALLKPFIYRRYVDFSAIEALRHMKLLIQREIRTTTHNTDIKKGEGGIREIEFIVQVFQIIHGGRDRRLQVTPLKQALPILAELQLLSAQLVDALYQAYIFLRNLEHSLQGWNDQQTQQLPTNESDKQRIAYVMGFVDWHSFSLTLASHRKNVSEVFASIVANSVTPASNSVPDIFSITEQGTTLDAEQSKVDLATLGYTDVDASFTLLKLLRDSRAVQTMPEITRSRFEKLLPLLIQACAKTENNTETLSRVISLVQAVAGRSAYFVMLAENPQALERLVKLCSASSWIANQLMRYPSLLDELLDYRSLFELPDKANLMDELRQQLLRVPEEDLEQQMEVLRYFKLVHSLKVAACEVTHILPLMKVSDYLTWLAEVLLQHVLDLAWRQVAARFGEPGAELGQPPPSIAIIGYGKLGGIELGHGSDIDLVFVHDAQNSLNTDGEKPVDNATFFARLGQRIIHLLTAKMPSGIVYDVDMRLRPSGNSGLLVTTLHAFEKYQREDAWTWEHQALVRARPVAGSVQLAGKFQEIRSNILTIKRNKTTLQYDVLSMRGKMHQHLDSKLSVGDTTATFHIKQNVGGMVDIEFIVQFLVLRHAHQFLDLLSFTDNIRLLEILQKNALLPQQSVGCLREAYIFYRSLGHRLHLQGKQSITNSDEAYTYKEQVSTIWKTVFNL